MKPYSLQQFNFRVEGPLYGYRASAARAFDPKYANFKRLVRLLANVEGVPSELGPQDDAELFLHVYWTKKARIDTSNILKALEDGLFKQDRRVSGIHATRHEHSGRECAEVFLTIGRGHETQKDRAQGDRGGVVAPQSDGTCTA